MANKKTKIAVEVGAGLVAAGAVGYYFFGGKNAKKNKKIVTTWATKLKKDVEAKVEVLEKMDKTAVTKVIEKAAAVYKGSGEINTEDLTDAVVELKANWQKLTGAKAKSAPKSKPKSK